MKTNTYTVCLVGGEGDPLTAETLPLVAALLALGIPAVGLCPFTETIESMGTADDGEELFRRAHTWYLQPASPCKKYEAGKLMKRWADGDWLAAHQSHPFALIRFAFHFAGVAESPVVGPILAASAGVPVGFESVKPAVMNPGPWLDKAFRDQFRDDPRAFIGDAFAVLDLLRAELEKSVPLLIVRKGKRAVRIPLDATPEEENELLQKLDPKN